MAIDARARPLVARASPRLGQQSVIAFLKGLREYSLETACLQLRTALRTPDATAAMAAE